MLSFTRIGQSGLPLYAAISFFFSMATTITALILLLLPLLPLPGRQHHHVAYGRIQNPSVVLFGAIIGDYTIYHHHHRSSAYLFCRCSRSCVVAIRNTRLYASDSCSKAVHKTFFNPCVRLIALHCESVGRVSSCVWANKITATHIHNNSHTNTQHRDCTSKHRVAP